MRQTHIVLVISLASLSACVSGGDPESARGSQVDERWEAFRQAAKLISSDPVPHYIFGGDMLAVGEDGLRREYERYFGGDARAGNGIGTVSSSLTVDHVSGADVLLETSYSDSLGGRYDLIYCIQRDTFSAAELSALDAALPIAQESWSSLVNVRFRHDASQDAACAVSNTNVFFNVRGVPGDAYNALSFFPHDPRAARELLIYDTAFTTTAGGRDLQGILRHEIGHTLGFRHEHIWIDCSGEDLGDARHVTPYDENSVMHYPECRTIDTGGYRQTDRDYEGAIDLYGMSAALIVVAVL